MVSCIVICHDRVLLIRCHSCSHFGACLSTCLRARCVYCSGAVFPTICRQRAGGRRGNNVGRYCQLSHVLPWAWKLCAQPQGAYFVYRLCLTRCANNLVNGEYVCQNEFVEQTMLKNWTGFNGWVCAGTLARAHTRTHTCTHIHVHTHKYTRARKHIQMHTETPRTQPPRTSSSNTQCAHLSRVLTHKHIYAFTRTTDSYTRAQPIGNEAPVCTLFAPIVS